MSASAVSLNTLIFSDRIYCSDRVTVTVKNKRLFNFCRLRIMSSVSHHLPRSPRRRSLYPRCTFAYVSGRGSPSLIYRFYVEICLLAVMAKLDIPNVAAFCHRRDGSAKQSQQNLVSSGAPNSKNKQKTQRTSNKADHRDSSPVYPTVTVVPFDCLVQRVSPTFASWSIQVHPKTNISLLKSHDRITDSLKKWSLGALGVHACIY